jgi:uncharacterized glyoxalase superfamily protein PhnB
MRSRNTPRSPVVRSEPAERSSSKLRGIDAFYAALDGKVTVTMPIVTRWYGMREFAIADPDGYLITFAERAGQS